MRQGAVPRFDPFDRLTMGSGLSTMPGPPPKGRSSTGKPIAREVAEVDDLIDDPALPRDAQDADVEVDSTASGRA